MNAPKQVGPYNELRSLEIIRTSLQTADASHEKLVALARASVALGNSIRSTQASSKDSLDELLSQVGEQFDKDVLAPAHHAWREKVDSSVTQAFQHFTNDHLPPSDTTNVEKLEEMQDQTREALGKLIKALKQIYTDCV